mmetsp:Transcript_2168/g.3533  ORF Transcript_2168/g.3533 Transcript_2168/m.3533 type:complete len:128 (-) Transcript_2168:464-847(-)|eukprot:CAMPEP_0119104892 /NCGR_PEP_ID=MMETSP1180-20130426/2980_1 /TAXON_ID=3052 ORGANISM="Chlamydomonas cf sp, Strain CCMP681" /NCGR_SAMPLE_ID=MMETSP1180 /ASSEMBLY_ACC=CAM_ASM_000741 /LENGTH=127 /DNA_ID=CAMNT_0007089757 /DNA_START=62 /DNA_END=445 /DNA_ORIENTATION=-
MGPRPLKATAGTPGSATAAAKAGKASGSAGIQKKGSAVGKNVSAEGAVPVDAMPLEERIRSTRKQLADVERQIYNLESQYFENANPQGNALRGYEGLLSSTSVSAKKAQFKAEDRVFSGSSVTGQLF